MGRLGSPHIDCRQDGAKLDPSLGRASYLFNATIAGIEEADGLIIVGSNPRKEAPVINARIRKRWLRGNFPIWVVGEQADLTYDYQYLGAGAESLAKLANQAPAKLEKPIVLVGQGALARADGAAILSLAASAAKTAGAIKDDWNGFSVLHTAASRVGALDVGAVPGRAGSMSPACSSRARSTCCSCSVRMKSTCRTARLSFISARMATAARIVPM
jgi:NADH-quinone oxidoreductase subunit G